MQPSAGSPNPAIGAYASIDARSMLTVGNIEAPTRLATPPLATATSPGGRQSTRPSVKGGQPRPRPQPSR
jgi:hypothetical protein